VTLQGKVALVTGGGTGHYRAIALVEGGLTALGPKDR
jgi:NAD(P)-dependent dehydrogenase (short-subunit alcohol dehydrogenase family)